MTRKEIFYKFEKKKDRINDAKKVLLITHNDMDASGAVISCKLAYGDNVDIIRCTNRQMSWEIKNAICNEEVAAKYDLIMACDISCTEEDAQIIDKSLNRHKFILLDHHHTALGLNKYPWGCVCEELLEDSKRADAYKEKEGGHSSGTSLMHDFLGSYHKNYQKLWNGFAPIEDLVFNIAAYDTWDWVNIFNKENVFPDRLDTLFKIYGPEFFEKKMFTYIFAEKMDIDLYSRDSKCLNYKDVSSFFDKTDQFVLELEDKRIRDFLERAKYTIKTGTMKIGEKYADIVYATETAHVQELFEYMKDHYPNADYYFINCGGVLSIRTTKEDRHAGDFAAIYGGGGHQGAAGINISPLQQVELLGNIVNGTIYLDNKETRLSKFVECPEEEKINEKKEEAEEER